MSSAVNEFEYPSSGQAPDLGVLSKSKFMAGVQCLKRLHLQTYAAESEIVADASQQGHLEGGRKVGELARTAFPGGVLVEAGNFAKGSVLAQTAAIIEHASVPAIFEAAFRFQGVFIRVDILQRQPGNRWRLIEVKSSTSCKEHYLYDLAIQLYVLSGCGLDVSSACLMHLDRSYVYDGQSHDATKLFTIVDFTAEVRAIEKEVPGLLAAQRNVLLNPIPPTMPPDSSSEQAATLGSSALQVLLVMLATAISIVAALSPLALAACQSVNRGWSRLNLTQRGSLLELIVQFLIDHYYLTDFYDPRNPNTASVVNQTPPHKTINLPHFVLREQSLITLEQIIIIADFGPQIDVQVYALIENCRLHDQKRVATVIEASETKNGVAIFCYR